MADRRFARMIRVAAWWRRVIHFGKVVFIFTATQEGTRGDAHPHTLYDSDPRMDETLDSQLVAKIQWAWDDGSPIAGSSPERWAKMAATARRRWFSFERRNDTKDDNRDNRVEDLARGLCDQFEHGGLRMAGPLISDYRWLAEQLADVLAADNQ